MNHLERHTELLIEMPALSEMTLMLSVESSGFIETSQTYLTTRFKSIGSIFTKLTTLETQIQTRELMREHNELKKLRITVNKIVNNVNYRDVKDIKLPVITGMNTTMKIAIDLLLSEKSRYTDDVFKVVDHCSDVVSKFVTDEKYRTSSRPIIPQKLAVEGLDIFENMVETIITSKNPTDTKKYSELYYNITDLEDIRISLIDLAAKMNIKQIQKTDKELKQISVMVDQLVEDFTIFPNRSITPERMKELSAVLETTAKYVSMSTTILYISLQITEMYKTTIIRIK